MIFWKPHFKFWAKTTDGLVWFQRVWTRHDTSEKVAWKTNTDGRVRDVYYAYRKPKYFTTKEMKSRRTINKLKN